jgi:hypothetical protein
LLRVNAEERCMEFDMFKFSKDSWFSTDHTVPQDLPTNVKRTLWKGPTMGLVDYFTKQLHRFEVSRMLQLRIPFDTITGLHYYRSGTDSEFSLLVLQLNRPAIFNTRRLNCSASLKNVWTKSNVELTFIIGIQKEKWFHKQQRLQIFKNLLKWRAWVLHSFLQRSLCSRWKI